MFGLLMFTLLFTSVVNVQAQGLTCVKCNQARGNESNCNNQPINGGNTIKCGQRQVCTTDIRCDGRGRVLWIKNCERRRRGMLLNQITCHPDSRRCNLHCDTGDFCNENVTSVMMPSMLACGGQITQMEEITTPEPTTTPDVSRTDDHGTQTCSLGFTRETNGEPGPDMTSFTSQTYNLNTQNKFLMAQAFQAEDNFCKFQVRCQLDEDEGEDDITLFNRWCGVAFGIHSSSNTSFRHNFRISRREQLEARGQGFSGPSNVTHMEFSGLDAYGNGTFSGWDFDGHYVVNASNPDLGCSIRVDYWDAEPDDMMTLTVSGYDVADLTGACADNCFGSDPANDISACIDGLRQNPA